MTKSIGIFKIEDNIPTAISHTLAEAKRKEDDHVNRWISAAPEMIEPGLRIIGQWIPFDSESGTATSREIDALGFDKEGHLVVIEYKRHEGDRDIIGQSVDYAAAVASWMGSQVEEIYTNHCSKVGRQQEIGSDEFELALQKPIKIRLVCFGLNPDLQRMVDWLSSQGLELALSVFSYARDTNGQEFIATFLQSSGSPRKEWSSRDPKLKELQTALFDKLKEYIHPEASKSGYVVDLRHGNGIIRVRFYKPVEWHPKMETETKDLGSPFKETEGGSEVELLSQPASYELYRQYRQNGSGLSELTDQISLEVESIMSKLKPIP